MGQAGRKMVAERPFLDPLDVDRWIGRVASRQEGVVGREQLVAAGVTRAQMRARLSAGRLCPVFLGAFAVGVPATSVAALRIAALLSTAPSFISHRDAVEYHRLWAPIPGPVHITVAHGRKLIRRGIVVHRTRHLSSEERRVYGPMRVTSPARTLVDVAGSCTERQLTRAFDECLRIGAASSEQILSACNRAGPRAGAAALRELALGPHLPFDRCRSRDEARFLRFCVEFRIPIPLVNVPLLGYEPDFFWRESRLIVELDGPHHDTERSQAADAVRDLRLETEGYRTLRVRPSQVRRAPSVVAGVILESLGGRLRRA